MSNIFYSKELGPQLYPDDAICHDGLFDALEDYEIWLETQRPEPVQPTIPEAIKDFN